MKPLSTDEESLARLARALGRSDELNVAFAPDGPLVRGNTLLLPDSIDMATQGGIAKGYVDLLIARRLYSDTALLDKLAANAQDIARAIDDKRACDALFDAYPGARALIVAARTHRQETRLATWSKLTWRKQLTWRIERVLWNETPPRKEDSDSLASALGAIEDVLDEARASTSTADSVRHALRILERVRALSAGGANNMMFTTDRESASNSDDTANDTFDFDAQTGQSESEQHIDSDAITPDTETSTYTRPQRSIPLTAAFDRVTDVTGQGDASTWRKLRSLARAQTEPLKARLERALKADEQTHWKREQERGELDRSALVRLATSPGYRTPFRSTRARPGRDAAVTLLIDRSGSMAGRKIELARLCAAALCDALDQLGFACEVLGYSSIEDADMRAYYERWLANGHSPQGYNRFVERLDFEVYKRFDSANLSGLARMECGHENPDGEALQWAADRLLAKRARRHILMVLSDGYPATGDGHPAILRTDLRLRIDELLARKIELIGIGILDDAVEEFYPTCSVVEEIQQLPAAAFEVLGRTLLGHREWMMERMRA